MTTRVLAVRLDSAGDVLLTGPAVRALAARAERLTLLCGPRGRAAGELLPGPDAVIEFSAPWIDPEPGPVNREETERLVESLSALELDAAVVFTSFHQSPLPTALLLRLAGVPFVAAVSDDYPGSLLDVRHRLHGELHEVERALSLADAAGYPAPPDDDLTLRIRSTEPSPVAGRYVVIHPGASVPARAWSPERYRGLVAQLAAEGVHVVVTGSQGERALAEHVAGEEATCLAGTTTLAHLAGVLERAEVVVCGNTGPAHLAAAVGTPVVSLFAPTVPAERWRPWGVPHVLLGDQEIACGGCRSRVCPVAGHPCLSAVEVDDVVRAVRSLADVCASREAALTPALQMAHPGETR